MSSLQQIPAGELSAHDPEGTAEPPAWTDEIPAWLTPDAPAGPARSATADSTDRCRRRLVLAAVAIAGVLVGAIASGVLVVLAFVSAAEDIGRGIGLAQSVGGQAGPVEQFPAVAPGTLGSDAVLDGYAQSCFGGDLGACDDLAARSAPMSEYETYAATCGGRVTRNSLATCTDLG